MLAVALLVVLADTGAVPVIGVASPATPAVSGGACGADSMYARVPVYVRVTVARAADTVAAPELGLIAQTVATRVRAALGASPTSVPRGDSLVTPDPVNLVVTSGGVRGIDSAGVRVVARRDHSVDWTPLHTPPYRATALLTGALADAKREDDVFFVPEAFTADSIPFTLTFEYDRMLDAVKRVPQVSGPPTFQAFTLRVPLLREAAAVRGSIRATYPEFSREGGAEGLVRLQFVVDTTGRVDASTVRDVWPADRPRLTGTLGEHYLRFVEAAREGVLRGKFVPAQVAGCTVRQLVVLPMTWTLQRR